MSIISKSFSFLRKFQPITVHSRHMSLPTQAQGYNQHKGGIIFLNVKENKAVDVKHLQSCDKKQYICPTSAVTSVILDVGLNTPKYCPTSVTNQLEMLLPDPLLHYKEIQAPPLQNITQKEAIDKIRRQRSRMNQHKKRLHKWKHLTIVRKHAQKKRERKHAKNLLMIDRFESYAEKFDADALIRNDLEMARRGGYYLECYGENSYDKNRQN